MANAVSFISFAASRGGRLGAVAPYRSLEEAAKRATSAVSSFQSAIILQASPDTQSAVQETAVATKALLQAALQATSGAAVLKATRLAATNAIQV